MFQKTAIFLTSWLPILKICVYENKYWKVVQKRPKICLRNIWMVPYDQVKLADRVWERKWQRGSCATTVTWHFFIIIKIWIWIDVRGLVKTRWRLLICFFGRNTAWFKDFFLWRCMVLLKFWDKKCQIIPKLNLNTVI